ncbi:hypothetical protein QT711_11495 [Sporosarcina saromensis]|uniref:Uncharacterized protein n=1 Tax=Sporosarcina saromensis TaxID=359365 RepID=A0ABU4GE12_9BACL|nr:hypothetical protein [Sporosarcina saromensis]MDW0113812.1 hypothetical protein [Sporosarcina saromensis]
MLKKVSVTGEDFTLNVEGLSDNDIATISLVSYLKDEKKSTKNNIILEPKDTAEVYVSPDELREMIDAMTYILEMIEREGE